MKKYFLSIIVSTLSIVSIFAQQNSNQDDLKQLIEKGLDIPLSFTAYPHEKSWLLNLRKTINEEIKNNK